MGRIVARSIRLARRLVFVDVIWEIILRRQTSPNTTNETLARRLVGPEPGDRLKLYSGPGAYNIMLNDLLAQVIDGVLMDRPYAMLKVEQIKGDQQGEFSMLNITSEILPGLEPKRAAFAVRGSDFRLLGEINDQLDKLKDVKRELIRQYLPHPESYIGSQASAGSGSNVEASLARNRSR